ncbi:MAG: hypothetical protein NTV34_06075, partial [Proteobacteria bacterium]|nr:hypothetical protein [Pseudomonadota bacterium]
RLLSPVFETWLQESEVVSRSWLSEASREQNLAKLGDLIHRMINRLPVDAHITSVNGSFVTISAGSEQSINLGDEFDVLNARLQTLHPANGSWLSFSTSKTGRIKVIESKGKSSIAKVTGLIHESSLAVGHGIRIEAISGRNRFARPEGSDTFANAHSQDGNALVPAMRPDGGASASKLSPENLSLTKSDANKSIQSEIPMEQKSADAAPQDAAKSTDKESIKDGAKDSAKDAEKDTTKDSIQSSSSAVLNTIAPVGSELDTYAGLKSWAIGGSGAASAALPLWLVNSIGATIKRPLSESIVLDYGLDLGYGQTGKGSFFGYGVHGAGMYKMKLKLFDGADHIFGGLEANLHSTSVGGESSGGFDLTTLNLVAGIAGDTNSSLIGTKLDWNASLRFALQESGRFGVSGTMKKVTGGRGMLLNFLGYIGDRPKEGPQFGAGLEFGSGNYSLSDSSSATYNIISLLGLARWSL